MTPIVAILVLLARPLAHPPLDPVAIIAGTPLSWADIGPRLAEAAGSTVLEETVIDDLLRKRLIDEHLEIAPADLNAERTNLLLAIADEADTTNEGAGQLLDSIRTSRGFGPQRFEALLWRNAALRKLVLNTGFEVAEQDITTAIQFEFGARYRIRIATYPSALHAAEARSRLGSADGLSDLSHLPYRFAEEALLHSTDRYATRGGLVLDASAVDPALPAAVRSVLPNLTPGSLSDVIAVDGGFALVLLESRREGRAPTDDERARVEAKVRRRLERLAMDALARDLLDRAKVIITDESLKWSWERRGR